MGEVKILGCELWACEKVKRLLGKRNFYFRNQAIVEETDIEVTKLSIFGIDPTLKPRKTFFFKQIIEPLKMWIGVIWFENEAREAYLDDWVFEVYGEENMVLAKGLAIEFAEKLSIDITVKLIDKNKHYEEKNTFSDDYW